MDVNALVIAKNPEEMSRATAELAAWAKERQAREEDEAKDLEREAAAVRARGWPASAALSAARRARKRAGYYAKAHEALAAGYCMIPDMLADVVAVRVTRSRPPFQVEERAGVIYWPDVSDVATDSPAAGEGRYVDPAPTVNRLSENRPSEKTPGKTETVHITETEGFADVAFPAIFAKPQVIDEVNRAMALKVFDEIAVLPARRNRGGGDPLVLGRVVFRQGYSRKVMAFLITWFIDTKAL